MPQNRNDEPGAREDGQKNAAAAIAIAAAAGVHAPPGVEARLNSNPIGPALFGGVPMLMVLVLAVVLALFAVLAVGPGMALQGG
jgi:hypothetical protein